jgi:hypothetical protein
VGRAFDVFDVFDMFWFFGLFSVLWSLTHRFQAAQVTKIPSVAVDTLKFEGIFVLLSMVWVWYGTILMVDKYYEYETYISYDVECRDSGVVCFLFAGHSFSDEFQAIMTMDSLCVCLCNVLVLCQKV